MPVPILNSPTPRGSSRLVQVDVLRGAAILLILYRHANIAIEHAGVLRPLALRLYFFSATGIDLFFVLSGFLIGGLLFKEIRTTGALDVRRFLLRRTLRIWPAYFAFLAFVVVRLARQKTQTIGTALAAIVPNLLHLQNYLGSPRGITWSLAVQEHFYLGLPLLLLLLLIRSGQRRGRSDPARSLLAVPVVAIALILACSALRIIINFHRPYNMWTHMTPTHLRVDGLFFGVLIAWAYHFQHAVLEQIGRHRAALVLLAAGLAAPSLFLNEGQTPYMWTLNYAALYIAYGGILIAFIFSPPERGLPGRLLAGRAGRALATIGVFTYSIYLWHYDLGQLTVQNYVLPHLPQGPGSGYWLLAMTIYYAVAIAAGIIMAKLIEIPVIRVRDRLLPGRATPLRSIDPAAAAPSAHQARIGCRSPFPSKLAAGTFPRQPDKEADAVVGVGDPGGGRGGSWRRGARRAGAGPHAAPDAR